MIVASIILALLYFGFHLVADMVDTPIARWLSTGCALAATYCFVYEMTTRAMA